MIFLFHIHSKIEIYWDYERILKRQVETLKYRHHHKQSDSGAQLNVND